MLIAFEGIDGSGKTTQALLLTGVLTRAGYRVLLTAEPSKGPYGERIRALSGRPDPEEEERLFRKDRADHVDRVIRPGLLAGNIVITDRYYYSSAAYQGARGLDPGEIIRVNRKFAPAPDITFILDISVDAALRRILTCRKEVPSIFERREDLLRTIAVYQGLSSPEIIRIPAERPEWEVSNLITEQVCERLSGLRLKPEAQSPYTDSQ